MGILGKGSECENEKRGKTGETLCFRYVTLSECWAFHLWQGTFPSTLQQQFNNSIYSPVIVSRLSRLFETPISRPVGCEGCVSYAQFYSSQSRYSSDSYQKNMDHPPHIQVSQETLHHSGAHMYCSVKNSASGSPPEI